MMSPPFMHRTIRLHFVVLIFVTHVMQLCALFKAVKFPSVHKRYTVQQSFTYTFTYDLLLKLLVQLKDPLYSRLQGESTHWRDWQ